MKILCVDAATKTASAAVVTDEALLSERIVNVRLNHSSVLMPMIESVLHDSDLTYKDLDFLAVTTGPGSFTGLRIGLATVKGIAQAAGLPIIPLSTLEALAYNLCYVEGIILPILDARRGEVYTAAFQADGTGKMTRLTEDSAMKPDVLLDTINKMDGRIYILGDALPIYGSFLKEGKDTRVLVSPESRILKAASLGALALNRFDSALDYHRVEPVYLRKSYAEEKHA